jgi:plasmid stabilization system protein ParE
MAAPNVVITETARADLDEIWDYIARDSERKADFWIDHLLAEARLLAEMPNKGHVRQGTSTQFRFWTVGRYLIVYRPDARPLEIIHIVSAYRDIAALLPGE